MTHRTPANSISRMPRGLRDAVSRALADGATWRRWRWGARTGDTQGSERGGWMRSVPV
jgi:hypothetical protein